MERWLSGRFHAHGLEDRSPSLNFRKNKSCKIFWRSALGCNDGRSGLCESCPNRWIVYGPDKSIVQLLDDVCGGCLGQKRGLPIAGLDTCKALLMRGRDVRQERDSFLGKDRYGLHLF